MHPGEAPGHGVDIDEALAAKYPYQRAYLPVNRLRRTARCGTGEARVRQRTQRRPCQDSGGTNAHNGPDRS